MMYAAILLLAVFLILAFCYRTTILFMFAGLMALGFAGYWGSKAEGNLFFLGQAIISGLMGAYCIIKAAIPPYTW